MSTNRRIRFYFFFSQCVWSLLLSHFSTVCLIHLKYLLLLMLLYYFTSFSGCTTTRYMYIHSLHSPVLHLSFCFIYVQSSRHKFVSLQELLSPLSQSLMWKKLGASIPNSWSSLPVAWQTCLIKIHYPYLQWLKSRFG